MVLMGMALAILEVGGRRIGGEGRGERKSRVEFRCSENAVADVKAGVVALGGLLGFRRHSFSFIPTGSSLGCARER